MEAKEEIEFIKEFLEYARKNQDIPIHDRYIHNGTFLVNDAESLKQVISLLQQGEAYRQIIEELVNEYGDDILENDYGLVVQLKNLIEILKGKYFPKEAKQDKS